jgi:hypothetical protein
MMVDEILLAKPNASENMSWGSSVFAMDSDGTCERYRKLCQSAKKTGTCEILGLACKEEGVKSPYGCDKCQKKHSVEREVKGFQD